jgi:hypothetical protein
VVLDFIRQQLAEQLATVERHIIEGEMNVSAQHHRINAMEQANGDAALSRSVLANFETALRLHYDHRDRILRAMTT